jgi:anion-transporting  ArsA/GET3 family ATPase
MNRMTCHSSLDRLDAPDQTRRPMTATRNGSHLWQALERHRVVVCLGSGGVGKTTTAAALAVRAAMAGRRVLCLTIDPARRLANSLGLDVLHHDPQRIDQALFARHGLTCRGELSAMMLDMKHTFDHIVARHASSPEQRERIYRNRLYQYVSTSLAGTQEYMAMEKLYEVRDDPRFDLVVLDTPPTTNALDFLDAPQKLVGAIDSPVMRWFVEQLERRRGAGLVGRGAALVFRGLARFTGAAFLDHIGEFLIDVNELFGGFRERARAVYDGMRGPDVAFLIVTSPSPLNVAEALYFGEKLHAYDIRTEGVIVNRVHPTLAPTHGVATLAAPPYSIGTDLLDRMARATADAYTLGERDREGIRRLRDKLDAESTYAEVPAFDQDVHDLGALAELSRYLVGAEAA